MDIMQELLYSHNYIMDDVESLFPKGISLGIGIIPFADTAAGEPEPPTVMTRSLGFAENEEDSNELFKRIVRISTHMSRGHCDYDANAFPAATYIVQDGNRRESGAIVVAVAARRFTAEDYNIDADDFMRDLYSRLNAYAVRIGRVYGGVFF